MKKTNWIGIILLGFLLSFSSCKEEDPNGSNQLDLVLGEIGYAGSGCPANTLDYQISTTDNKITFRFESFNAFVGGTEAKRINRKACSLAIPVTLPPNFKLAASELNIMGEAILPEKTKLKFTTEMFFPSEKGEKLVSDMSGGGKKTFSLIHKPEKLLWTSCGGVTTLRINTSMLLKANQDKEVAEGNLNFDEVDGEMILKLKLQSCE